MNIAVSGSSYLFSDHVYASEGHYVYEIIRRLAEKGHQIFIAASEARLRNIPPNVQVNELGPRGILPLTNLLREQIKWWTFSLRARRWLKQLMQQEDIHTVHHFHPSWPGCFSLVADLHPAFLFGPLTVPNIGPLSSIPILKQSADAFRMPLYRRTLRHSKRILLQTEEARAYVKQADPELLNRTQLVPCGVDTKQFTPTGQREEKPTILFVGEDAPRKGLDDLIVALPIVLKQVPDARLRIIGDGRDRTHFQRLSRQNGMEENIEFLGFVSQNELIENYQGCSLLCLPSLSESFGIVLLEAMACGKPFVATPVGAAPLLAKDAGLIVPRHNPKELASALTKLLIDPELRCSLGSQARQTVQRHYDWSILASRIESIYEECLPSSNPDAN